MQIKINRNNGKNKIETLERKSLENQIKDKHGVEGWAIRHMNSVNIKQSMHILHILDA
jgi:hypothetical protein